VTSKRFKIQVNSTHMIFFTPSNYMLIAPTMEQPQALSFFQVPTCTSTYSEGGPLPNWLTAIFFSLKICELSTNLITWLHLQLLPIHPLLLWQLSGLACHRSSNLRATASAHNQGRRGLTYLKPSLSATVHNFSTLSLLPDSCYLISSL